MRYLLIILCLPFIGLSQNIDKYNLDIARELGECYDKVVVDKETERKNMSFAFSSGNIIYNGTVPIRINTIHIIKIDKIQDFLSNSNILNLLFDIYIETKKKIDINNNNKNGT